MGFHIGKMVSQTDCGFSNVGMLMTYKYILTQGKPQSLFLVLLLKLLLYGPVLDGTGIIGGAILRME